MHNLSPIDWAALNRNNARWMKTFERYEGPHFGHVWTLRRDGHLIKEIVDIIGVSAEYISKMCEAGGYQGVQKTNEWKEKRCLLKLRKQRAKLRQLRSQQRAINGHKNGHSRRTLEITQRGIRSDNDLADFFEAALADVDAGRADIQQMKRMTTITGQMIALQNLRLKVASLTRKSLKQNFFITA